MLLRGRRSPGRRAIRTKLAALEAAFLLLDEPPALVKLLPQPLARLLSRDWLGCDVDHALTVF